MDRFMTFGSIHRSAPSLDDIGTTYGGYPWLLFPSIVTLELGTLSLSRKHSPKVTLPDSGNRQIGNVVHLHRSTARVTSKYKLMSTIQPIPFLFYSIFHSTLY